MYASPMATEEPFTAITLDKLVTRLKGIPPGSSIFVATATGSKKRAVMSVHFRDGSIILACAPPNTSAWAGTVDWALRDHVIAAAVRVSRQAVSRMRQRIFGVIPTKRRKHKRTSIAERRSVME